MLADKRNARERPTHGQETLRQLIRARGIERYGLFFGTGEGSFFPNGTEESSGYAIDDRGRVFFWWTGWDAERGAVTLETWEEVEPDSAWDQSAEYRRARQAVGLSD